MSQDIPQLVERLSERLPAMQAMLTCAESCTGGWIAKVLTDRPGSSGWFDRGFVTYTNRAKQEMLGVSSVTLATHGAVSRETVLEMAHGALAHSAARYAVAVSGIAGPGGGSKEKPVGTVWIAWVGDGFADAACAHFPGDREAVRLASVEAALAGLVARL
jgi:nicotinamide-nucleotide amidase